MSKFENVYKYIGRVVNGSLVYMDSQLLEKSIGEKTDQISELTKKVIIINRDDAVKALTDPIFIDNLAKMIFTIKDMKLNPEYDTVDKIKADLMKIFTKESILGCVDQLNVTKQQHLRNKNYRFFHDRDVPSQMFDVSVCILHPSHLNKYFVSTSTDSASASASASDSYMSEKMQSLTSKGESNSALWIVVIIIIIILGIFIWMWYTGRMNRDGHKKSSSMMMTTKSR